MGAMATSIVSMVMTPIEHFIYYVLNESSCHSQCGGDACFSCDCETEGQDALEGGETEIKTDCCLFRHSD